MTAFLLLTLYAPLASWGEIAVGEERGSWDRPSRSAVLGLFAAALGIERGDQAGHDALEAGYGLGVRLDAPGVPLTDYHTAQTVAAAALRRRPPATRAALLEAGERQTVLSRRGYRQDALATVAVWPTAAARWSLDELAAALRAPAFALFAGRKSNPFGLPVHPEIVTSDTLAGALARRPPVPPELGSAIARIRPRQGWGREVAHDPCTQFPSGLRELRREVRRDAAPQRGRWQFAERVVEIGEIDAPVAVGGLA